MNRLQCDICGGQIEMQDNGKGICRNCGMAYSISRLRDMFAGAKVSVTGSNEDVEQWKALVGTYMRAYDYAEAEKMVKKILEAVPADSFANDMYQKLASMRFFEIRDGVLVNYSGKAAVVEIPDGVTEIGASAFFLKGGGNATMKKVVIPGSVTKIGQSAFSECAALSQAILPEGLRIIGKGAFWACRNLTDVTLPDSLELIDQFAFNGCMALTRIVIPARVKEIGTSAFFDCQLLEEVIFNSPGTESHGAPYEINDIFGGTPYAMKIARQREAGRWRSNGVCQYCGGHFKGAFTKKCALCGKVKDY